MVNYEVWRKRKAHFWRRLWEDLELGYLDKELLPVLILFNLDADIHTLSSCSGRVIVLDAPAPWVRGREPNVVFKKHTYVTAAELISVVKKGASKRLWVNVTGPILHISTAKLTKAMKILASARKAGFKHSGVMQVSGSKGYILELTTGVYASQLLRDGDLELLDEGKAGAIANIINELLLEGKKRLDKLYEVFRPILPFDADTEILSSLGDRAKLIERRPLDIFRELAEREAFK